MRFLLALVVALAPARVRGDGVKLQPTHDEGDYGGVVPGQPHKADTGKRPKKPPPKGTLAWIGFEEKNGGSELFFQSIAPFEVSQRVDGGSLVLELGGLHKLGQNTWRPIDTRFFDTPIARVVARRASAAKGKNSHPADVEVRITFKNPKDAAQAAVRTATEQDGYFYAYLTFGGADVQPAAQEPEK
jgi:hypothetical protein